MTLPQLASPYLAAAQPDRVRGLNSLLGGFLKGTHALIPAKNPNYNRQRRHPSIIARRFGSAASW
jgi:hypothetical protein